MSDENKAIVNRFFEELNKGNLGVIDTFIADNFVEHEEMPPGTPPGREGVKAFFSMLRGAFPDLRMDVQQVVAEGDLVSVFLAMNGTHNGELGPSPEALPLEQVHIVGQLRFQNGKA